MNQDLTSGAVPAVEDHVGLLNAAIALHAVQHQLARPAGTDVADPFTRPMLQAWVLSALTLMAQRWPDIDAESAEFQAAPVDIEGHLRTAHHHLWDVQERTPTLAGHLGLR